MHPEITDVLAMMGILGLLVALTWGIYALLPPSPPKAPKPIRIDPYYAPESTQVQLLRGIRTLLILEILFGGNRDH